MEHVQPVPGSVPGERLHRLAGLEQHDVLEAGGLVGQDAAAAAGAGDDLEVDEVDVHGVNAGTAGVVQLPKFDGALGWARQNAVVDVVEGDAVDGPLTFAAGRVSVGVLGSGKEGRLAYPI